jgi:hypothetical protein
LTGTVSDNSVQFISSIFGGMQWKKFLT